MKEKEVVLKDKKEITNISKEEIDNNNIKILLDNTIPLDKVVKEIKNE